MGEENAYSKFWPLFWRKNKYYSLLQLSWDLKKNYKRYIVIYTNQGSFICNIFQFIANFQRRWIEITTSRTNTSS